MSGLNYSMVREILVREIRDAKRFSAIQEAAEAIARVRVMEAAAKREDEHLNAPQASSVAVGAVSEYEWLVGRANGPIPSRLVP